MHVLFYRDGMPVLAVPAGETVRVAGSVFSRTAYPLVKDVEPLLTIEVDIEADITFAQDTLVVCKDCDADQGWVWNLIFARPDRLPQEGVKIGYGNPPVCWSRLRHALRAQGNDSLVVEAGLKFALTYPDEMVVAASSTSGWLIRRADIPHYLSLVGEECGIRYTLRAAA